MSNPLLRYHKSPRLRLLKLENVQIALDGMKREGIQLLNIGKYYSNTEIALSISMLLIVIFSFL